MPGTIIDAIEPADPELAEEWVRRSDDPKVLGIGSSRWAEGGDWPWRVDVAVASLVREEPLQGELRDRVTAALEAAPGVVRVVQEDREVWIVSGDPTGPALIEAAARVVDDLAERARASLQAPDSGRFV